MSKTPQIPADITRCRPSKPCTEKDRCLRYICPMPQQYAAVADFSLHITFGYCQFELPLGSEKVFETEPEKEIKPWPKD